VYDPVPTTHLQLSDLCPPITTIWAGAPGDEQRMADYLVDFLVALDARSVVLVLAGRFNGCAGPVVLGVADQQRAG